MINSFSYYVKE